MGEVIFGIFCQIICLIKTSTSKLLRSCSSQIFVNIVKKIILELPTFLLETNL